MQLDIGLIFTQVIAFILTFLILKRFAWIPLLEVLDRRKEKIQSDFNTIEEQKRDVQRLIDDYTGKLREIDEQARIKIQAATDEGRQIAQKMQEEAQRRAKEILDRAQTDLQHEIAQAKLALKNDLVKIVTSTTEKILEGNLSKEMHEKLIADFVEKANFS